MVSSWVKHGKPSCDSLFSLRAALISLKQVRTDEPHRNQLLSRGKIESLLGSLWSSHSRRSSFLILCYCMCMYIYIYTVYNCIIYTYQDIHVHNMCSFVCHMGMCQTDPTETNHLPWQRSSPRLSHCHPPPQVILRHRPCHLRPLFHLRGLQRRLRRSRPRRRRSRPRLGEGARAALGEAEENADGLEGRWQ